MPRRNWKTGARYCSRPSVDSGTLMAAAPKQTSGSAVTTPVAASSAMCPAPSVPKVAFPADPSHSRKPSAGRNWMAVSAASDSMPPMLTFFFTSP